jgi:hypothetical protein
MTIGFYDQIWSYMTLFGDGMHWPFDPPARFRAAMDAIGLSHDMHHGMCREWCWLLVSAVIFHGREAKLWTLVGPVHVVTCLIQAKLLSRGNILHDVLCDSVALTSSGVLCHFVPGLS